MAGNREFFNRRLHSLLGVIPVGVFLILHLVVNNFATRGEEAYNSASGFMGSLPFRILLEVVVIYLPLLFHAIYGLYIAFTAKNNVSKYGFFRNWMFYLQRITGSITLLWVARHVWERLVRAALGGQCNFEMMADILTSPAILVD